MLVVDHERPALAVDVDAVDGAHEVRPGVGGREPGRAAEASLEQTRLEAAEQVRLVRERGLEVALELGEPALLGTAVRDERLLGAGGAVRALVREVEGELFSQKLRGMGERLRVDPGPLDARGRVKPEERALGLPLRVLAHEAGAARGLEEELAVRDLQHAVGKGAHLHVGEAGVAVVQAKAAQREPLVRTLEVGLDLRGGERRTPLRQLGLAVARHHYEASQGRVEPARRSRA